MRANLTQSTDQGATTQIKSIRIQQRLVTSSSTSTNSHDDDYTIVDDIQRPAAPKFKHRTSSPRTTMNWLWLLMTFMTGWLIMTPTYLLRAAGSITMTNGTILPDMPSTFNLGWIGPVSITSSTLIPEAMTTLVYGQPGLVAFKLAVDYLNNLGYLDGLRVVGVVNDSRSDPGLTAIVSQYQIEQEEPIALIGEYTNPNVQQVQYVARYYKIPHASPAAPAAELTTNPYHINQYPYFFRLVPSIALEGTLMVPVLAELGFTHFASVYVTDVNGASAGLALDVAARAANMTILQTATFETGGTKFDYQLQLLQSSKARIFVFFGQTSDFVTFIRAASLAGLVGEGYTWFTGHAVGLPFYYRNVTSEIPDLVALSKGFFSLQYHVDMTSPFYAALVEAMHVNTTYRDPFATSPSSVSLYACLTVDTVLVYAVALKSLIYNRGINPHDGAEFLREILNVQANGTTGPISFTSTGDRITGFDVLNFQNSDNGVGWIKVGEVSSVGEVNISANAIQWPGSKNLKPVDVLPPPPTTQYYFTDGAVVSVLILSAFCHLIGIICLIIVIVFWSHPVIRSASPPFLICMVLGVMGLNSSIIPRALVNSRYFVAGANLCTTDLFLTNLGYTGMVSALLVKIYRLHRIFHRKNLARALGARVKDLMLGALLTGGLALQAGQLLALIYSVPVAVHAQAYDDFHIIMVCETNDGTSHGYTIANLYQPVILSTRFTLMAVTTICAWMCRGIGKGFSESSQLLYSMYNMLLLSVLLPPIELASKKGEDGPMIAYCACVFLICSLTLLIMFLPKYLLIMKRREQPRELSMGRTMQQEMAAMGRGNAAANAPPSPRAGGGAAAVAPGSPKSGQTVNSDKKLRAASTAAAHGNASPNNAANGGDHRPSSRPASPHLRPSSPNRERPKSPNTERPRSPIADRPTSPLKQPPRVTLRPVDSSSSSPMGPTGQAHHSIPPGSLGLLLEMFRGHIGEKEVEETWNRHKRTLHGPSPATPSAGARGSSPIPQKRLHERKVGGGGGSEVQSRRGSIDSKDVKLIEVEIPPSTATTISPPESPPVSPPPISPKSLIISESAPISPSASGSPELPSETVAPPLISASSVTSSSLVSVPSPDLPQLTADELPAPPSTTNASLVASSAAFSSTSPRRRVLRYHFAPGVTLQAPHMTGVEAVIIANENEATTTTAATTPTSELRVNQHTQP